MLQTTRQIPRHGAGTQIATLNTSEVVTENIAKLAGEIRPDIASGGIGWVESRRWFVRGKRVRQYSFSNGFLHVFSMALPGKGRQTER
ncbi:MAG: hypothetical protein EGQ81_07035 [Akkermansia sp.]|nr:hypothetical protein [Akkermansia sp.]